MSILTVGSVTFGVADDNPKGSVLLDASVVDNLSSALAAAKRSVGTDKRLADTHEPAPVGQGAVVLVDVLGLIDQTVNVLHVAATQGSVSIIDPENLKMLGEDLAARAVTGKQKYGTYLRTENGRRAIVDLYQEVLDAIMYSAQARMEGDADAANYLALLLNIGQQLAGILNKRAGV